jgi:hypothetical protein
MSNGNPAPRNAERSHVRVPEEPSASWHNSCLIEATSNAKGFCAVGAVLPAEAQQSYVFSMISRFLTAC